MATVTDNNYQEIAVQVGET